jgi:hypothetical protein
MKRLILIFLMLFISTLPLVSCSRVQEPSKGELETVKLNKLDGIPTEYGDLVNVTANPQFPNWAQLWFKDDDGTVRVVSVGFFEQKILKKVIVIPRN